MKLTQVTDQQIAFILRQAEKGTAVEEVCRKAGISIQTYYRWRKKCGGLMPSEMRRLKQRQPLPACGGGAGRYARPYSGCADADPAYDPCRRGPAGAGDM